MAGSDESRRPDDPFPSENSRLQAVLAYALGAFTGVVMLVLRREDRFVQYHALQSIALTVVALGVGLLLWIFSFFPLLGFLYGMLLRLFQVVLFVVWVYVLWQTYRGRRYQLPFIGGWAERQAF